MVNLVIVIYIHVESRYNRYCIGLDTRSLANFTDTKRIRYTHRVLYFIVVFSRILSQNYQIQMVNHSLLLCELSGDVATRLFLKQNAYHGERRKWKRDLQCTTPMARDEVSSTRQMID